jgi:Ni/Fe-hydrogenase subunit HybB-like protein
MKEPVRCNSPTRELMLMFLDNMCWLVLANAKSDRDQRWITLSGAYMLLAVRM